MEDSNQSWGSLAELVSVVDELDAAVLAEDEHAPHVVVVIDAELGAGPAAGPFAGTMPALVAAERLQAALNTGQVDPPVRAQVVRLFTPGGAGCAVKSPVNSKPARSLCGKPVLVCATSGRAPPMAALKR